MAKTKSRKFVWEFSYFASNLPGVQKQRIADVSLEAAAAQLHSRAISAITIVDCKQVAE